LKEQKSKVFSSGIETGNLHPAQKPIALINKYIAVLTESINPTDYLKKLRKRDQELGKYLGTNCPQIKMLTETGKIRLTRVGNTKDIFRLIQSIPSPKAESFFRSGN